MTCTSTIKLRAFSTEACPALRLGSTLETVVGTAGPVDETNPLMPVVLRLLNGGRTSPPRRPVGFRTLQTGIPSGGAQCDDCGSAFAHLSRVAASASGHSCPYREARSVPLCHIRPLPLGIGATEVSSVPQSKVLCAPEVNIPSGHRGVREAAFGRGASAHGR